MPGPGGGRGVGRDQLAGQDFARAVTVGAAGAGRRAPGLGSCRQSTFDSTSQYSLHVVYRGTDDDIHEIEQDLSRNGDRNAWNRSDLIADAHNAPFDKVNVLAADGDPSATSPSTTARSTWCTSRLSGRCGSCTGPWMIRVTTAGSSTTSPAR
jgi:hypothetical protein